MPVRIGLNVAYAMLADGLDSEQREELDSQLYGLAAETERANKRFQQKMMGGGEDQ